MQSIKERRMQPEREGPLLIEPMTANTDLADLLNANVKTVTDKLLEHGALLFRGFSVRTLEDFDRVVAAITPQRLAYTYGSTPRTAVGKGIYTATEYPPAREIPLHNENSYQREWPLKMALCCMTAASSGGETPLANMRRVTAAIGARLMETLERHGIKYVRHYSPFVDVPWQNVFQSDDPAEVGRFCEAHDIAYEWLDAETLRTSQVCQGTASHPITGERIFFNQAHLFHVSSLGPDWEKTMMATFGPDRLPRQSFYGDGESLPLEDLSTIRRAFEQEKQMFPWQAEDVLLLDNMQYAHGRRPYAGTRKVLAALLEPYASNSVPA